MAQIRCRVCQAWVGRSEYDRHLQEHADRGPEGLTTGDGTGPPEQQIPPRRGTSPLLLVLILGAAVAVLGLLACVGVVGGVVWLFLEGGRETSTKTVAAAVAEEKFNDNSPDEALA